MFPYKTCLSSLIKGVILTGTCSLPLPLPLKPMFLKFKAGLIIVKAYLDTPLCLHKKYG